MAKKNLEQLISGAIGCDGFAEELEKTSKKRREFIAAVLQENDNEAMRIFVALSASDQNMVVDILKDMQGYFPVQIKSELIEAYVSTKKALSTEEAKDIITKANSGSNGNRVSIQNFADAISDAALATETGFEALMLAAIPRLRQQALKLAKRFYARYDLSEREEQIGSDIYTELKTNTGRILWFKNGKFEAINH